MQMDGLRHACLPSPQWAVVFPQNLEYVSILIRSVRVSCSLPIHRAAATLRPVTADCASIASSTCPVNGRCTCWYGGGTGRDSRSTDDRLLGRGSSRCITADTRRSRCASRLTAVDYQTVIGSVSTPSTDISIQRWNGREWIVLPVARAASTVRTSWVACRPIVVRSAAAVITRTSHRVANIKYSDAADLS